MNNSFLFLSILLPIIGSIFVLVVGKKFSGFLSFIIILFTLFSTIMLIPQVIKGTTIVTSYFFADALNVFFAVVSSLVAMLIVIYSLDYMKKYKNLTGYYFFITLFSGSMMGLLFSSNLILIYVFWEISALCSWWLIGFHQEEEHLKAANKAFLITFSAASLMLIGFILVYLNTNTFNLIELKGSDISYLPFVLIFIGIMAKSCVFPLHTWLPSAGVAPSPVTAFLHAAVLVKIGIYGFARFFCNTFQSPPYMMKYVAVLAAISAIIAGCSALRETDIKRILAYSTISQLGFIFVGLAINSKIGIIGALIFVFAHALGKAGLFLTAGIIEQKTGTKDIKKLGGMMKVLPISGIAFILCSISVIGIPPLAGFFGKLFVIISPIEKKEFILSILVIFSSILTLLYLLRFFNNVFLGQVIYSDIKEDKNLMLVSVCFLAILSLVGGILINYPAELIKIAQEQMAIFR